MSLEKEEKIMEKRPIDVECAFDLFCEVHGRTDHWAWATRAEFDSEGDPAPERRRVWGVIAEEFVYREVPASRDLNDYAFALFRHVHGRLGDYAASDTREQFDVNQPRKFVWQEIARVFDERKS